MARLLLLNTYVLRFIPQASAAKLRHSFEQTLQQTWSQQHWSNWNDLAVKGSVANNSG
jgi:hypothetical protein